MKIAHGTLVMAIDGRKMLLLRNEGDEKYVVLETVSREDLANPATHEQGSDAPGRAFSSTGDRRSAYGDTDWHEQAEERFAIEGAERLEREAAKAEDAVVVLAPPRTLGILRKHWGHAVRDRLAAEIGKDLVHHDSDDIARAIADFRP